VGKTITKEIIYNIFKSAKAIKNHKTLLQDKRFSISFSGNQVEVYEVKTIKDNFLLWGSQCIPGLESTSSGCKLHVTLLFYSTFVPLYFVINKYRERNLFISRFKYIFSNAELCV